VGISDGRELKITESDHNKLTAFHQGIAAAGQ
jgi:hypothetical protein